MIAWTEKFMLQFMLNKLQRRSTLSVYVCVSVQSCQSFCGEDGGFRDEDKGFLAKTKDFLFFFVSTKNPSSLPQCLSMYRHTNEGESSH